MNKLAIEKCELINPHWVALRFTGQDLAFRAMTELLGRQRDYNAYWLQTVLAGQGGWIVRIVFLEKYKTRFHNLDRALTLAQTRAAQSELKR